MRIAVLTAIAVLGAGLAAPAFAQQNFPDFATMDANKDGRVTKAEFMASLNDENKKIGERVFAARDANKDGVLTRDEMPPPARQG